MIYLALAPCENDYNSQSRTAHALLNSLLCNLGYKDFEISKNELGRPCINLENIDISIAHSGECVLVGILSDKSVTVSDSILINQSGTSIGVDIEYINESIDLERKNKILKRYTDKKASSAVEFYCLWTENEAYGKMTGEGVICNKKTTCQCETFIKEINGKKYSISYCVSNI